jgi:hypothetical protein
MRSIFYVITQNMPTNEAKYKQTKLFCVNTMLNFLITDTKLSSPLPPKEGSRIFLQKLVTRYPGIRYQHQNSPLTSALNSFIYIFIFVYLPFVIHPTKQRIEPFNPLTPELNPSAQRCLTRFFTGSFAS